MTAKTVVVQIRKLVELQKVDAQIYNIRKELLEKPIILEQLKQEFETKKARLKELEEKYKAVQLGRKSQEMDLHVKEEAIAKANAQLSQIKTNKEYTAKLTEIEHIKADKSLIEEKILFAYDEGDEIKARIDKEKAVLGQKEKDYLASKEIIEEAIKELEEKISNLEGQRKHITPEIERISLDRYEKILVNKDGLAIVPVQGTVCGGCNMNIPAQVVNEIKMHDKLILCELCARILFLEEDL